jgi:4,5-dihydroxyphthalate decarboxylase
MHTLVIRRAVYEANRWLAESLFKAFIEAKEKCLAELHNPAALPYMLPWMLQEIEEARVVMGPDYWPYGVEANRRPLEAFALYAHEQGLTPERFALEQLFADSTLEEFKI